MARTLLADDGLADDGHADTTAPHIVHLLASPVSHIHTTSNSAKVSCKMTTRIDSTPQSHASQAVPVLLPDDVELVGVACAEIRVLWGDAVIGIEHLTPPRDFYVGEPAPGLDVDFLLPREKLHLTRIPLLVSDGENASVMLPAEASGTITFVDEPPLDLADARRRGIPNSCLPGARTLPLPMGASARIHLADFVFEIRMVAAGKAPPHQLAGNLSGHATYFALTAMSMAGLMLTAAFLVPPLGTTSGERLDHERLILIQQYLSSAAERERAAVAALDSDTPAHATAGAGGGATGAQGSMGKESSIQRDQRHAVQGPRDNPDPHLSKEQLLREAAQFGMLGLLNASTVGDVNAPTAPWGRETSLGLDDSSAMGRLFGGEVGDAFGAGGLGISGSGHGGGFRGETIGLGRIGTWGRGLGKGADGFGSGHGRLPGTHAARAPRVRIGTTQVSGRLPKEVIQRIVRQNFGRFRLCYEKGLAGNPQLMGRVSVRFAIDRQGTVSSVSQGDSSLPNAEVVGCVVRAFYGLSFPKPEGGIVTVVYPISFAPE